MGTNQNDAEMIEAANILLSLANIPSKLTKPCVAASPINHGRRVTPCKRSSDFLWYSK